MDENGDDGRQITAGESIHQTTEQAVITQLGRFTPVTKSEGFSAWYARSNTLYNSV